MEIKRNHNLKKFNISDEERKPIILWILYQIIVLVISTGLGLNPIPTFPGYPFGIFGIFGNIHYADVGFIGVLNLGNLFMVYRKKNPIKNIWIRFLLIIIPLFLSINLYLALIPYPITKIYQTATLYGVFKKKSFQKRIREIKNDIRKFLSLSR